RLVLFSPIANEKHQDPNFGEPSVNNTNISDYAEAMREAAGKHGIIFVDLFNPSEKLFADAAAQRQSLTINGLHLTDKGDRLIAEVIYRALFRAPSLIQRHGPATMETLRQAVLATSEPWHAIYRT